ncbi:hypothetical protein FWG86_00920 [Candidatus Saccharibacteria bacterium]|nr:hypothetical protein [Candidatus Saccharibacteria bacterium]
MKTLHYSSEEKNAEAKTGIFLRHLAWLESNFSYLVPRGWRCIIKMQTDGEIDPFWMIDVQSEQGGGSYAEAKMSTLERFLAKAATGGESIADIMRMLEQLKLDNTGLAKLIRELKDPEQMTKDMYEWLRDGAGIAPYYGGVRIMYKDLIVEGTEIRKETGEIRIAFSGASEEQDLFFALSILRELNGSFAKLYPNTQGKLDLSELEKIPAAKLWLDLFKLKGV